MEKHYKYRIKIKEGVYLAKFDGVDFEVTSKYCEEKLSSALVLSEKEAHSYQDKLSALRISTTLEIVGEDEGAKYREIDEEAKNKFLEALRVFGFDVTTEIQNKLYNEEGITFYEPNNIINVELAGEYVGKISYSTAITGDIKDSGLVFDVSDKWGTSYRHCLLREITWNKFLELLQWKGLTKEVLKEKREKFKKNIEDINKFLNEPILKDDKDDSLKLDDAINQYTKTVETLKSAGLDSGAQFAEQIAKWLTELKQYKEQSNQLIWDDEYLTILVICENNKAYDFITNTFIAKANSFGIIREGTYPNLPFRIKVSEVCRQRVIFKVATNQFHKILIGFLKDKLNELYRV